ncbi:hypothetical protein [Jannaschia sp. LMIT008]|uniref:hypothetical protein n=1 Tax=Jannaschia maritima TaxID=3032585 RepID=UPI0028118F4A|nr:hypothetical protein [Jannaschia sp. LMIT008]
MKIILPALLAAALALPAAAQNLSPDVQAQVVPGANLTQVAAANNVPLQDLVAYAQSQGFTTTTISGGGAAAGGVALGGLGTAGAVVAGVVVVAGVAAALDDDSSSSTTTTTN